MEKLEESDTKKRVSIKGGIVAVSVFVSFFFWWPQCYYYCRLKWWWWIFSFLFWLIFIQWFDIKLLAFGQIGYLWFEYIYKLDKVAYNKLHPYTSWIPITCVLNMSNSLQAILWGFMFNICGLYFWSFTSTYFACHSFLSVFIYACETSLSSSGVSLSLSLRM